MNMAGRAICSYFVLQRRFFTQSAIFRKDLTSHLLNIAVENGVYRITLNSPKTRNALSLEMLQQLSKAFENATVSSDTKCLVLASEGNVFSAGHNLKELTNATGRTHHKLVFSTCTKLMEIILKCPVPVVAQVDGVAAAAGCQLVAMCDIAVASSRSSFSTPGVNLGLFCSTPGIPVARSVPLKTASYMLYTGLPITAQEALVSGLVSRVVPHEELEAEMQKIVTSIQEKSLPVIKLGKRFLLHQLQMDILSAYRQGEDTMVENLQLDDAQEGIKSFIEKRKPIYKNK